jgi:ABC-type multidrug transport system fused ATPase/permease subunit
MTDPKRMLVWMALFLGAVAALAALGALLHAQLAAAFLANPLFNGLIAAVLAAGAALAFAQVVALRPAVLWTDRASRGFATPKPSRLIAPLARILSGRERQGFTLSILAMQSLLDSVRRRLDAASYLPRALIGLLIFLGLLGTFWSLVDTPGSGAAFASLLFGLAAALVLGVLVLQARHAQHRFLGELEEFLAGRAQLPSRELGGESTLPAYLEALLQQTTENLSALELMMAKSEEERRATQAALTLLTDRLTELSDHVRAGQKFIGVLSRSQDDLRPAIAELGLQIGEAAAGTQELRAHVRNLDVSLARLVDEVSGAREQLPAAMRQEARLMAQSFSSRARAPA